ncbi:MAG: hypothetical protein EOP52_09700 [Sphingobacteriales bacterium]|nr:MAG: hypothetical protein EOP52_09700 [Sphingobacteriales bacterium]
MFWEYDTRLGRRWNPDPRAEEISNESPYATNHGNPILYQDPNGDIGVIGALIGAGIGGVASLTKSVLQNGWVTLKDGKTWKKAGVNAVGGAIVGATGGMGAGIVATATTSFGSSLAEDAIDEKPLDYKKAAFSSVVATTTFGAARYGADKLSKAVTRHWWNRGNTNAFMRHIGNNPATNVGQLVDRTQDVVGVGTSIAIDKAFEEQQTPSPKYMDLPEVVIKASRAKGQVKVSEQARQKVGVDIKRSIDQNGKKP